MDRTALPKFLAYRFSQFVTIFLFAICYLLFAIRPASAQIPTSDVPNTPHYSTQTTIIEIMSAVTCQLTGIDPINPKQSCLGVDQETGKIGFVPSASSGQGSGGGAIGAMGNMITMLYTPPVRTADYFQNLAQNFGITKTTYAQEARTGTGFEGLRPLLGLWTAFRNIVYLVFVIVFIVIGLAIMLRIKIDPRTVMTIQNQIPKIIIGILLVTFSYAIAGFLIDLMYVTIHITGNVITSSDTKIDGSTTNNVTTAPNPFAAANRSVGIGAAFKASTAVGGELEDILKTPGGRIFSSIIGGIAGNFIISAIPRDTTTGIGTLFSKSSGFFNKITGTLAAKGTLIGAGIGSVLGPGGTAIGGSLGRLIGNNLLQFTAGAAIGAFAGPYIISGLATLIIFLILAIAMLAALFRLWFILLLAYISILIDVVFSPFWIIGGLIPGSPINVSGWIRNLVANLSVFPVVIAMFLLGKVFQDAIGDGNAAHFVPPLIGDRLSPDAIKGFISLGIVLITPNILNVIKTALKVPKIDTGLGKAIGVGTATPGRLIGGAASTAFAPHFDKKGNIVYPGGTMGRFLRGFGFVK